MISMGYGVIYRSYTPKAPIDAPDPSNSIPMEPKVPIETATFLSDLNPSNPAHSDGLNQADAHMRLTKAALKATFAHTGQLTTANGQLIPLDGAVGHPAYSFASEPALGIYRIGPGLMGVAG